MKPKKKPTDATLRNVRAANKRLKNLETRIRQLEKWQRDVIGGGSFKSLREFNKGK